LPSFRGVVASVDATFIVRATRVQAKVARDVAFSYQEEQPYYVITDTGLTITERLGYTWDAVARGGYQRLDFRRLVSLSDVAPQLDYIVQYGGGFGYRAGRVLRVGLDATYFRRHSSAVAARDYRGFRAGLSVSYGLPQ